MKYCKIYSSWREITAAYRKENGEWIELTEQQLNNYLNGNSVFFYGGNEETLVIHTLVISGPSSTVGSAATYVAVYDGRPVSTNLTWSVTDGGTYATIAQDGTLTILTGAENSPVTISASYNGLSVNKAISVTYDAGAESETETTTNVETNDSGQTITTTTTTTTTTDGEGNTTVTEVITQVVENEDGSLSSIEQETETTSDGTITSNSTTTNYDESGNTIGSQTNETTVNPDGSSTGSTTNYNAEGNPTDATNTTGDTAGNVDTQEVEFDESGNTRVTGYEIDTTGSDGVGKDITGDGVNTEFVPFADDGCGFIMHIVFESVGADQPNPPIVEDTEDTGANWLYNIMSAKATIPVDGKYPGFDIRWAINKKTFAVATFQFRYAQQNAGNTIKALTGKTADGTGTGNTYDIIVTYDPELVLPTSRNTFYATSPNGCMSSVGANVTFPSNDLDFTLGYALDMQGEPYRYANVTIHEFSITKICNTEIITPEIPEISYANNTVTITCETSGASIFYRLNQAGNYSPYSSPITISADTVVQAYSELMGQTSDIASATCVYDNGIAEPVIDCDGVYVTIMCETPSVDIYYRFGTNGEFVLYDGAIEISATTTVQAYAELNGDRSNTVTENCEYDGGVKAPVIECVNNEVFITCETEDADIYYKFYEDTGYTLYTASVPISADCVVIAFSELDGVSSTTVSEICVYDDSHDYSQDYLTFRVLTGGTIAWKSIGTGHTDTIQYSKNGGEWTSITAASTPATISVVEGDVVRFKGTNTTYAKDKSNYAGFEGGTAYFDIEGNINSLLYGDNFASTTALTNSTYQFCSIFKKSHAVSAENLILPATTLKNDCYRAMFSWCEDLVKAPALPATTLATECYWYMFEECAISEAPELPAKTISSKAYGYMFTGCTNLSYIKCLATNGITSANTQAWVGRVAASGTFIKDEAANWTIGANGIPTSWVAVDEGSIVVEKPEILCDGEDVTILCGTSGANIYYKIGEGNYETYNSPFSISATTTVSAYAVLNNQSGLTATQVCEYISSVPIEESNRVLGTWTYNNQTVQTPYSVNAIDGRSSSYAKGTFNFETSFALREAQPTYLWFQHADQSATVYIDDTLVEKHWGGYNAFFVDVSNYVHSGSNNVKVTLKNNEGNNLAPAAGDFNFNATLGKVKLFTSPVLPAMEYGYDGFHVTSDVATSSATIYVKTTIPTGATVTCEIDDGTYHFGTSGSSTGEEMVFSATVTNPHLWHGTADPHLYNITLNVYYEGELYHTYQRPYGLRFYEYVISSTTVANHDVYTGFLLNGEPYLLRGCCMHDDIEGRANALTDADYTQTFSIVQELGCNFLRLAHYPHPKEVYDWCDRLGIIVQTEASCVNKMQSTMPEDYYTHLVGQYADMVNQHYNHPSIIFWGLSNETTTDDKDFAKAKIEQYTAQIKALDPERWVGYVMSHSYSDPYGYYNSPSGIDWVGGNIYVGWYIDKTSNDPTSQLNTRVRTTITNKGKALAFSEYGCGGTQHCHSDNFTATTTTGNYERHDIEYQMWLHEGHIAAIRNFPQLLFTGQWQLFDIAVANRNEGYTVCLDGVNASTDDNLRRLNNKGLVERDHITKKDTFYIYKAEWSSEKFVHICGKDYTKMTDRVIKCYTNDPNNGKLSLYVNNSFVEEVNVTDNIALFTAYNFSSGDVVRVEGMDTSDTFTFS